MGQLSGQLQECEGSLAEVRAARRAAETAVADLERQLDLEAARAKAAEGEVKTKKEELAALAAELQQVGVRAGEK